MSSHSTGKSGNDIKRLIPDAKIINTVIAADLGMLLSFFFKWPNEIGLAAASILAFIVGYFTPRRTNVDHDTDLSGL